MKRLKYLADINPPLPSNCRVMATDVVSFLPMERIGEDGSLDLAEAQPAERIWSGYTAIIDGDVVVAKITPCFENGKGALCNGLRNGVGFGSTELIVIRARKETNRRFLYWLTRSHEFRHRGEAEMRGSAGQKRVTEEFVSDFCVREIDEDEQQRTAWYLDEQSAKIDRLIGLRRRQLKLLREQRAALIQQAVTRGLNPQAPLKDSGLPWLGEIPAHWQESRLKHLCSHIVDCLHSTPNYTASGDYPAIRTADVTPGSIDVDGAKRLSLDDYLIQVQRLKPEHGDIVYTREGERFGIAACVPPDVEVCVSQRMMHFRVRCGVNSEFIMWQLNTQPVYAQALVYVFGATAPHINVETIKNYILIEPPIEEQIEIVKFIRSESSKLDTLYRAYEKQIEMLTEYRASLIHECVTGQRRVP